MTDSAVKAAAIKIPWIDWTDGCYGNLQTKPIAKKMCICLKAREPEKIQDGGNMDL